MRTLLAALLALVCLSDVALARRPACPDGGGQLSGMASFYGGFHHGRQTGSGEIFNMHAMTAAHKCLPFNTRVQVIDRRTGRSVMVRINDSGPYVKGRVIDLSDKAARALGFHGRGVTPVSIHILGSGPRARD